MGQLTQNLELLNEYFPSRSKIASASTERQYRYTASRYSQFLGRHAMLDDLTDVAVGKWMRAMRDEGLEMVTINGYVTKLRAFWNWLAKKRIVELFPLRSGRPSCARGDIRSGSG